MRRAAAYVAMALASFGSIADGNWGHWRGPTGNSVALDAAPPTEWSPTKNVKWRVALTSADNSSPVVWGDKVFVTATAPAARNGGSGQLPTLKFNLLCYNRENGQLLWERTAVTAQPHQETHNTNGFAGASPCTDGEHVYAHFGSRGLHCYTMDGEHKWSRDFGDMETLNSFGEGSSPTIEGDMILVPWDHQGPSALHCLNKITGETIWTTPRDEPTCWATPLVVEHAGRKQVVMNGQNFARSYDLETGEELWRCSGQTVRPVASAVAENGIVFVGSGFQGAFLGAFRLDGRGDIQGTDNVAWVVKNDVSDMSSPLLVSGRLYFHKGKNALLSCVDAATGKPFYTAQRIPGAEGTQVYASPIAAGGHIYLTLRSGTSVVIKDSEKLEVVATNTLDETIGGTPAVVDGELFIRGEKHLYCISAAP